MPAVTVAIPAYKSLFLAQALQSVLAQDYSDFELLISDDSPDGSVAEVVSSFADSRIRLLEGPKRGLVANSAFLWREASSDLLKFLYDDDFLHVTAVRELVEAISRRSSFVYAFSQRVVVSADGQIVARPRSFEGDKWVWFDREAIPRYVASRMVNKIGEPSNILIRRSAFSGPECLTHFAGLEMRHLIDVTFYMNAGFVGGAVGLPSYLAAFRLHPGQVSARRSAPGFSIGVFEWEIILRGAVETGLVSPAVALPGVDALAKLYLNYRAGFEELDVFAQGLPELRELLAGNVRHVLTERFRTDLAAADQQIAARSSFS